MKRQILLLISLVTLCYGLRLPVALTQEPSPESIRPPGTAVIHETQKEEQKTVDKPEAPQALTPAQTGAVKLFDISGRFTTEYRGRFSHGQDDHDLFETLALDIENIGNPKVSFSSLLRAWEDVDGREAKGSEFRDILDAQERSFQARVYYMYLDVNDLVGSGSRLRLGRQNSLEAHTVLFDGLRYDQSIGKQVEIYMFGGARASHYRDVKDDLVLGSGVAYRPLPTTKLSLDYVRMGDGHFGSDWVDLTVWQRVVQNVHLFVRYGFLDENPQELEVRALWNIPKWDLTVDTAYFRSSSQIDAEANNATPYYELIGPLFSYQEGRVAVHKGFGKKFYASAGFDVRDLLDEDQEREFNREFDRYFAALGVKDVIVEGLGAEFTVERWLPEMGEANTSVSVEVSQKFTPKLTARVGTDFIKYKAEYEVAFQEVRESIDIRSYYVRVDWKAFEHQAFQFKYEVETNDTEYDPVHRVNVRYGVDF